MKLKQAKDWWAQQVNSRSVWRVEDLPNAHYKSLLVPLEFAYEIRRDIIVLGKPHTELSHLIHNYFWEIIACCLKPYTPYLITGISAMQLYLGQVSIPQQIDILTQESSTKINLQNISILSIEKNPDLFHKNNKEQFLRVITINQYDLCLESPESLLLRLRPRYFREYPQIISGFVKSIDFNIEILSELILQQSKPITYLRLAELFKQVGKNEEYNLFKNYLKITTSYALPGKSQIIKHRLPSTLAKPKRLSDPHYVTRFRDQLQSYADQITPIFKKIHFPQWNLQRIEKHIADTKKYDTYHSSTIEGYRVTQEEIQRLLEGREIISTGNNAEDIERKMALKGYLEAHQFVSQLIQTHFQQNYSLTESIIKEIYAHLFSPSVEAGLLEKVQLTNYRNDAVYIRNSRSVPPNHVKVPELMSCLIEEINEMKDAPTQAVMAHYGFVTIHPYFDGNGRVARFLMNYLLCCKGIPWITIRVEDRDRYFKSLETAQCDEQIKPFAEFITEYFVKDGIPLLNNYF